MRKSISAAAVALGGSLALAALVVPTTATASPPQGGTCFDLGTAGKYGEFIEGNDTHSPDAEGAVAVGGNADFSKSGFTVGNELTRAEVDALPGGYSLVVGGDLIQQNAHVQVMKGKGVYAGNRIGKGQLEGVSKGTSPIDFAKEFANLRHVSTELAKTTGGAPTVDGRSITFTGTDATANVFTVAADVLQKAGDVYLKVPAGSTTVINVTGGSYDQTKGPTSGFWIWDNAKGAYVQDDKLQSADGGAERAELLWNLPTATSVTKHSGNAWPGSVLAPNAAFNLGTGGPVNGSVWAKSLTGSGGAETHHYPFAGCLPGGTTTTPSGSPKPSESASTTPSGSPKPSESATTPGGTGSPTPGGSGSPKPSGSTGATPSPSASPTGSTGGGGSSSGGGGGLAFTGADGILPLTIGGVVVLAAGGGIVYAARRKKAGNAS
ncbi:choice-of-anchor A family protein [Kitasatospora sp. NA04385]|uniref:choice-of-anchor A family protein n=1 Tax=Kitasatospora sp. NA04385 TaxID=2742135 RepID=UPI0015904F64|nr:choice-of-anchor A family protein [Kitasatospora sp. NA04385]QKW22037.1 choice-of-anchor A family protein [Kitasatospora sp. NA04385]